MSDNTQVLEGDALMNFFNQENGEGKKEEPTTSLKDFFEEGKTPSTPVVEPKATEEPAPKATEPKAEPKPAVELPSLKPSVLMELLR